MALDRNRGLARRRIECIDCMDAADPMLEIGPKRLHVVAHWREHANASDNNSAIGHGDESLKRDATKGQKVSSFPCPHFERFERVFLRS